MAGGSGNEYRSGTQLLNDLLSFVNTLPPIDKYSLHLLGYTSIFSVGQKTLMWCPIMSVVSP